MNELPVLSCCDRQSANYSSIINSTVLAVHYIFLQRGVKNYALCIYSLNSLYSRKLHKVCLLIAAVLVKPINIMTHRHSDIRLWRHLQSGKWYNYSFQRLIINNHYVFKTIQGLHSIISHLWLKLGYSSILSTCRITFT